MADAIHTDNVILPNGTSAIVGIVTAQVISVPFKLAARNTLNLRVDVKASGVTVVGAISAILQHRDGAGNWVSLAGSNATAAITTNGVVTLRQNIEDTTNDLANMPIRPTCRVVCTTTNSGDRVTIDAIYFYRVD